VVFIVRDECPTGILFQCSDNTWQAYNGWPYKSSLYTHPKGNGPWADVSFDRPYGREAQYAAIVNDPLSVGSGAWLTLRVPLGVLAGAAGLRRELLFQQRPARSRPVAEVAKLLSAGHDEYWDIRQYESVVKLRDAGVNLLFLSGTFPCAG